MNFESSENSRLLPTEEPTAQPTRSGSSAIKYITVFVALSALALLAVRGSIFTRNGLKVASFNTALESVTGAVDLGSELPPDMPIDLGAQFPKDLPATKSKKAESVTPPIVHDTEELQKDNPTSDISEDTVMMSLMGATAQSQFNQCAGKFVKGGALNVKVFPGCISLFTNDIADYDEHLSSFITFCGCDLIGPKKYDFVSLKNAALISKSGTAQISFIATGDGSSVTIYNDPAFGGGNMLTIGPNSRVDLSQIEMGVSNWDNNIYSLILQSWVSCNLVCHTILPTLFFLKR